jgi:predicted DNA-binding transcriptional regulator YafY
MILHGRDIGGHIIARWHCAKCYHGRRDRLPRNDQIIRILTLARVLSESRFGVTVHALVERFDWDRRTVYRDLQALESAGFPLQSSGGRYSLEPNDALAATLGVEPEELAALFVSRQLAMGLKGTGLGRALDRLWGKLTVSHREAGLLVPKAPSWLSVRPQPGVETALPQRDLAMLERAVRERRVVHCQYRARSTGELTTRSIEPGELHWDPGLETLYVIAYCRLRGDIRFFAAHRFRKAVLTEERFTPRRGVSSRAALAHAFRIWRSETVQRVRIRFSPRIATLILERRWHASQRAERADDGSVTLELDVAGFEEIERWILAWGSEAQALGPDELVERVRNQLEAAASLYVVGRDRAARA